MPDDLEIRLLRYFVVVAEELHFSRAAQRLFIAQQALSRDIRRLEDRVGVRLLDRTTRSVELTAAGRLLVTRAQELLALHDLTVRELRGEAPSLTVDVVGPGLTPTLVLDVARQNAPELEFFARFHTGTEPAVPLLLAERLDVSFGRNPTRVPGIRERVVRYEPLAVLIPETHRLADLAAVPLEELRGTGVCFRAGNHATPAWDHAVLQLLASLGIDAGGAHPHVQGEDELARHVRDRDAPILTMGSQAAVPGAVVRPLVDPVAVYPWTMLWRADLKHPGLDALHAAIDSLGADGWQQLPPDAWLPEPESTRT
ncbi:DNA-binding transcriptional LysR family regulator [Kribbella amoyensis]|uniref:DNA-binding transcriptional LysR family regulator n=1 Tax=Kribbella amoyensis TaxID=996641 RepID=A0A561BK59_9ACTN|nr:LysR family transcriptional regulator [Kribbella amoyensis]TWD79152.1 DNA-binding transcriptional LysR family regulator [Kribbella amoyensis]